MLIVMKEWHPQGKTPTANPVICERKMSKGFPWPKQQQSNVCANVIQSAGRGRGVPKLQPQQAAGFGYMVLDLESRRIQEMGCRIFLHIKGKPQRLDMGQGSSFLEAIAWSCEDEIWIALEIPRCGKWQSHADEGCRKDVEAAQEKRVCHSQQSWKEQKIRRAV